MPGAILWQKFEGAIMFVAGLGLFLHDSSGLSWWLATLIFFAPDLSFAGYLFGPRVGAFCYNLVHVYALGVVLVVTGITVSLPVLGAFGALWLAHSGFDRMLGYGLKSNEGFAFTHLGRIGRSTDR